MTTEQAQEIIDLLSAIHGELVALHATMAWLLVAGVMTCALGLGLLTWRVIWTGIASRSYVG